MKLFTKGKVLFTLTLFLMFGLGVFTYPYIFNANTVTNEENNSLTIAKNELKLLQKDNEDLDNEITALAKKAVELEKELKDLQVSNKADIEKAVELEKARQAEESGVIGDGPTYPDETTSQANSGNLTLKAIEGVWLLKSEGFGEGAEGITSYIEIASSGTNSAKLVAYGGEKEDPIIVRRTINFRDSDSETILTDSTNGERISIMRVDNDTLWIGLEESEAYPLYRSTLATLKENYNRVSMWDK